jgi:hypothetical protein
MSFGFSPTLQVQFYRWQGSKVVLTTAANVVAVDKWNHISVVMTSSGAATTYTIYVNGVRSDIRLNNGGSYTASITDSLALAPTTSTPFIVGSWTSGYSWGIYVDELRISNVNRYTSDYAPASTFVSDASTQLLMHMDGAVNSTIFTDSSSFARTISNTVTPLVTVQEI